MNIIEWWRLRHARERNVLKVGIAITVLVLSYLLIEPSLNERNRMREALPTLRADYVWMQAHVLELKKLMNTNSNDIGINSIPLSLASVQFVLGELSLSDKISELRPIDNQKIRLNFSEINYSELVDLMFQLESKAGAQISNADFSLIENNTGMVQATLTLTQG
jgi:type II secretory pathway component PulM